LLTEYLQTVDDEGADPNEVQAMVNAGPITFPNPTTCQAALGTDPDPVAEWNCQSAQIIAADPNGPLKQYLDAANQETNARNVSGKHVSWFAPTRQIKTFHPRSVGMAAYRDALIEAIAEFQIAAPSE
jgi:hypothetical protein